MSEFRRRLMSRHKGSSADGYCIYETTSENEEVRIITHKDYAVSITLEDGTEILTDGEGVLNYTFPEVGKHKVKIILNEELPTLAECFKECPNLKNVDENIFLKCTKATTFTFCFAMSGLEDIPNKLFESNNIANDFSYCFIMTNITKNNGDLLKTNTATELDLRYCFAFCTKLNTFESLVIGQKEGAYLQNLFEGCTSLVNIPNGILKENNELFIDLSNSFSKCTSIKEIPETFFYNVPNIVTATNIFFGCESIEYIPEKLFSNNKNISEFSGAFNGCVSLTGETPKDEDGGELWERQGKEGYPSDIKGLSCFFECTKLSNYADIPSDWK